jgi:hypothetical protein
MTATYTFYIFSSVDGYGTHHGDFDGRTLELTYRPSLHVGKG